MRNLIVSNIPRCCWNAIALGGVIISMAVAVKIVRSNDVSIAVANTRLEVSNEIYKASDLLSELEAATIKLQQQQEQYIKLKSEYDRLLAETNGQALKQLQPVIEKIEPTDNLEAIASDLKESQQQLRQLVTP
ncbi:hypothetical protein STA3757_03820 [Stanieria sp. NIES-3757]|nr:hypothetical protein STA3757_03820 [Stanieria sp. NIES-3757]